jgi:hypothetical protein
MRVAALPVVVALACVIVASPRATTVAHCAGSQLRVGHVRWISPPTDTNLDGFRVVNRGLAQCLLSGPPRVVAVSTGRPDIRAVAVALGPSHRQVTLAPGQGAWVLVGFTHACAAYRRPPYDRLRVTACRRRARR